MATRLADNPDVEDGIYYPSEDGKPMAETPVHARCMVLLFQALEDGALEAGIGAPLHGAVEDHWRYAQAATVSSGTIEIQRMIVSKALLAGGRV